MCCKPFGRSVLGVLIGALILSGDPPNSFAERLGLLPRLGAPLATPVAEGEATFSDVVSFVQRNGWPQDLGRYCETLGLARANPDCRFKQLGAEDNAKPDEGHAINLPANTGDAVPYVLMLLRRPGTAEVFIASPQGDESTHHAPMRSCVTSPATTTSDSQAQVMLSIASARSAPLPSASARRSLRRDRKYMIGIASTLTTSPGTESSAPSCAHSFQPAAAT